MKHSLSRSLALVALCAGAFSALHAQTTLASWTFEQGYDVTDGDAGVTIYTPNSSDAADVTGWSVSQFPCILPEECAGDASQYQLGAYSDGRYWQLISGYNTRVLRVANDTEEIVENSDWTDADQHKVYYDISFPTKGYKDISLTFAIAPGNNTQTPVEVVVSTDGGLTWIDAGSVNTSSTWYTYEDREVNLSVNNKDNVRVRLLPTSGKTNWNMRNLSITAGDIVESGVVSTNGTTLSWPLRQGADSSTAADVSVDGLFSVAEFSYGSKLEITGTRTDGTAPARTLFQPTEVASSNTDDNALIFTIVPKKGLKFKPTGVEFKASRVGTNGGNFDVVIAAGETSETLATGFCPQLTKEDPYYSDCVYEVSAIEATDDAVTLKVYIKSVAVNKQYAFADFVITGDVSGEIESVPVYTMSVSVATTGAGGVTCNPAGVEFDEGTALTVTATENFGYHFTSWTDEDGNVVSTDNPYSFEITGNTVLKANYDQNNVYALRVALEGGANVNQVLFTPTGNLVDGVHYYEEGTDVQLTTVDNRIISFTNWEDNSTEPVRNVRVNSDMDLTASFSAVDYIVGWDFYYDQPNSERAADYKAESDNAGLLSLRNAAGATTSWLTRGVSNGAENGKWGARIWKNLSEGYYYEVSFSTKGYSNIVLCVYLGTDYNYYKTVNAEWSTDGQEFTPFGSFELVARGWVNDEIALPEGAADSDKVYIRFMPDTTSELVGVSSDYSGLCISDLYILGDPLSVNDTEAPELVTTIPADNADGASATGSIILTFNEKVVLGSADATLNGETITGKASGKSVIYSYAGLDYATTYTFNVPAGAITDRSGNAFAGTSITFTTLERVQPEARLFDAIVAADGSGDYTSVQDAIDAAPSERVAPWLIFVKNGNYNEHVNIPSNKPYLHFIGQDRDKTVILDDQLCGGDNAVHVSVGATVVINSNDCFFENITLENSYGHEQQAGPQALALNTIGDRTIFNNVAMLSYQDTWITPSTSNYRAYVRNSFIEGAVDFIYNSGNIYIDNTTLYIIRTSGGFIVAPSHGADVEWGYVFNNCTITAPGVPSETSVWLGRPWHNYPKTVFLNTRMEVTVPAAGWYETMGGLPAIWADWNSVDANGDPIDLSQRRDTYYYTDSDGEKVYGTAKNYLTDEEAAEYTVKNVLSGTDAWQPVVKTEACDAPVPTIENGLISWQAVPYAICYLITNGDEVVDFVTETEYQTLSRDAASYKVQAVNEFGGLSAAAEVKAVSGVDAVAAGETVKVVYHDIYGRKVAAPTHGVYIVTRTDAAGNSVSTKEIVK